MVPVTVLFHVKATCGVPWCDLTTSPTAPAMQLCPDGYSGWFGLGASGVQLASAPVAGLPSASAWGIAVRGRQR